MTGKLKFGHKGCICAINLALYSMAFPFFIIWNILKSRLPLGVNLYFTKGVNNYVSVSCLEYS